MTEIKNRQYYIITTVMIVGLALTIGLIVAMVYIMCAGDERDIERANRILREHGY